MDSLDRTGEVVFQGATNAARLDGDLGRIVLGGPRPFTIDEEFPDDLTQALDVLAGVGARAITVLGTTSVFCAGANLNLAEKLRRRAFAETWLAAQSGALARLAQCPLPTIAACRRGGTKPSSTPAATPISARLLRRADPVHDRRRRVPLVGEEIFGPVLVAQRQSSLEEVAARANASDYGLAAGVWTRDLSAAHRLARLLRAGSVYVNTWNPSDPAAPFGGFKQSGIGREHGREGLDAYLETKTVLARI